jgi:hypothetical protein
MRIIKCDRTIHEHKRQEKKKKIPYQLMINNNVSNTIISIMIILYTRDVNVSVFNFFFFLPFLYGP